MTNAELAVLSLIAEKPRHGYQIEQVIEERDMRRWTEIGFSSIYFLLKKLERQGLIKGKLEKTGQGPARKVYRPTDAGMKAVHAAIIEALSTPQPKPRPLMLGLVNLNSVSTNEALTALNQYSEHLTAGIEILINVRNGKLHSHPYFVDAVFELGLMVMQAELEWLQRFMQQLQAKSQAEQE